MQLKIFDLGLIEYLPAWDFQRHILEKVRNSQWFSALICCRHFPVLTLGRQAKRENILASAEVLRQNNIPVYQIERGGSVTYHGPGQLTLYPIINLKFFKKDIHWFLRRLEDAVIQALADLGVRAARREGLTGVWVESKKIASIGISIRQWVTFHGVSVNIKAEDLRNFSLIRPCGMDIPVTSLESELGRKVELHRFQEVITLNIKKIFTPCHCEEPCRKQGTDCSDTIGCHCRKQGTDCSDPIGGPERSEWRRSNLLVN